VGSLAQWIPDIQLEQVRLQVAKSFAEVFEVRMVEKEELWTKDKS
jgi:lipoyl(octanoyl) transferase